MSEQHAITSRQEFTIADTLRMNQANRPCRLLAIDRAGCRNLYEYDMPAGTTSLAIVNWDGTHSRQKISYSSLTRFWFDQIRITIAHPSYGIGGSWEIVGESQNGKKYSFPETGYKMETA